ncbi:calponin homology domain-containing protein DDB_G0272472-like [Apis dorsata]|uniref:calponin homology domain-containing protein DDB_G0272472-like n=1 Tax=Apis dorsata TaxID=7462 RepID=UPI001293D4E0|nr:calponin homology domain-containing protein DDB_G0272472-like [Apis dorsata]
MEVGEKEDPGEGLEKERESVGICGERETVEEGMLKEEELEKEKEKENEISNGGESIEGEILKEKKISNGRVSIEREIIKEKENMEISNGEESIVEGMLEEEELERKSTKISDGKEYVERKKRKEEREEKSEKVIESEILKTNNENTNLSASELKIEEEISVDEKEKLDETDDTLIDMKSRSNEEESVDVSIHYRISDTSNVSERTMTENVEEESKLTENRNVSMVKSKEIEVLKIDGDRKMEKSVEGRKLDLESKAEDFEALTVKSKLTDKDDVDSKSETLTKQFLKKEEEEEEEPSKNNIAQISKTDEESDRLNETNEKLEQNKRSTTSYHESSISKSILRKITSEEVSSLTKDSYEISRDTTGTKRKRPPTPPKRSSSLLQERSSHSPLRGKRESKESIGEMEDTATSSGLHRDSTESWTTRENIGTTRTLLTIISQSDAGVENIRDTLSNVDTVSLPERDNILDDLKEFGGRSVCLENDDNTDELRKYVENGARLGNGASSEIKRDYLHRETREKSPVSVSCTKQSVDGLPVKGVAKIVMEQCREEKSLGSGTSSKLRERESVERIEKIDVESRETREESTASISKRSADAPVERIVKIDVESSTIDESDEARISEKFEEKERKKVSDGKPVERIVKINVESSSEKPDKTKISKKCEEEEEVSYELHEKSLESMSIKQSVEKPVERIVKIVMEPSSTDKSDKVKISEKEKEKKKISDEKPVERIVKINVESTDESDKTKKCEEEERKKVSYELHEKSLESISIKQSVDKPVERIVKINVESSTEKPDKVKISEKEEERKKLSDGKPVERIVKINVESSDESDKTKVSKKCEEEEKDF